MKKEEEENPHKAAHLTITGVAAHFNFRELTLISIDELKYTFVVTDETKKLPIVYSSPYHSQYHRHNISKYLSHTRPTPTAENSRRKRTKRTIFPQIRP